jgi:hypothetical protein
MFGGNLTRTTNGPASAGSAGASMNPGGGLDGGRSAAAAAVTARIGIQAKLGRFRMPSVSMSGSDCDFRFFGHERQKTSSLEAQK